MPSLNSATRVEIEDYSDNVLRNKVRCELPRCSVCEASPDLFTRHQARSRKFYILCEKLVQTVICLVIRWRCPVCKKTFTQQPPFAFPRKRYTRESILDFSAYYVEDEAETYRATVLDDAGVPIFHDRLPFCQRSERCVGVRPFEQWQIQRFRRHSESPSLVAPSLSYAAIKIAARQDFYRF